MDREAKRDWPGGSPESLTQTLLMGGWTQLETELCSVNRLGSLCLSLSFRDTQTTSCLCQDNQHSWQGRAWAEDVRAPRVGGKPQP